MKRHVEECCLAIKNKSGKPQQKFKKMDD